MDADVTRLNELSGQVIGRAFTVLNTLGAGFLERSTRMHWPMTCVRLDSLLRSNMALP